MSSDNQRNNDTNDRNKRQKLDDNNNNNSVCEIDIQNLSKQTVAQLKEFASSIGISIKSTAKKNEIIEMIKAFYTKKQEYLVKQNIGSNDVNSFNKEIIEFKIKDGIDPLEWSFWKVFRNKSIYKLIMSNMDKILSPDYNSIINTNQMIMNNQFSMLRDKVIRNQYLVLSEMDGRNIDYIFSIFKTFRNNDDQDRLFYQQLFKHYNNYILEFNAIIVGNKLVLDGTNDREGLVNKIIIAKCLPALQILIQEYQYKPTDSNLKNSIIIGSIKFVQLILQHQPQLKESIQKILNNKETPPFKILYWLHNENLIDITASVTLNKINETISLKFLILICKSLLSKSTDKNNNYTIDVEEIESFSNSLSKQELKLPLSDASFQNQNRKEIILKLLDFYFSVCTNVITKPEFYNLYFKFNGTDYGQSDDNTVKFCIDKSNLHDQFKKSLQFGNFTLLKQCFENGLENSNYVLCLDELSLSSPLSNIPFIFSHCSGENNKERRFKFINSIINNELQHVNQQSNENISNSKSMFPVYVLLFLIDFNDLELFKHLSTSLKINETNYSFGCYFNELIKSNEMLEYLYVNNKLFEDISIWNFRNLQLLQHYETLESVVTIKSKSPLYNRNISPKNLSNEIIQHVIDKGPSVYNFGSTIVDMYSAIVENCTIGKFDKMKLFFIKFQLEPDIKNNNGIATNKLCHLNCQEIGSLGIPIKFLDWLFVNHQNYLKNDDLPQDQHQNGFHINFLHKIGRLNELNENIQIYTIFNSIKDIDIKSIDYFCNKLKLAVDPDKNGDEDSSEICWLFFKDLRSASSKGDLGLFEHIRNKHSWIFSSPKSKNVYSLVKENLKGITQLLCNSSKSGHLLLAEFFFQFLTLPKKSFNDWSSNVSKVYFKNKNFK